MKNRLLLTAFLCVAVSLGASAQSKDLNGIRDIAKMYGYTDDQINSAVNSASGVDQSGDYNLGSYNQNQQNITILRPSVKHNATKKSKKKKYADKVEEVTSTVEPQMPVMQGYPMQYQPGYFPYSMPVEEQEDDYASDNLPPIYGHDFFESDGLAVIPSYNAPVPAKYVLGPGDEVEINIWGASKANKTAVIANDGSLNLGGVGPVYLAGMTVSSAESMLKDRLSSVYSGLSDDRGDTFLRLTVGKIKGVSVNISGEVRIPGLYSLPSLSSIPSAIFLAGGLKENGSVRNIVVFRRGKKVADFDLYSFLFKGNVNENLRLQDGDIINVESYRHVVTVKGSVMRPMRYEMRDGENINDLIGFASGFKTNAQRSSVHVSRIGEDNNRDFDVLAASFGSFKLFDGDVVNVRSFNSVDANSVSVSGPVKYPGNYAIGGTVSDLKSLINAAGGLVEGAFTGYGQISRIGRDRKPEFISFDLEKVLLGEVKISLQREDIVALYSYNDLEVNKTVTITGAVSAPGSYSYYPGITVSDLVDLAGGMLENAYLARGIIVHDGAGANSTISPFNVKESVLDEIDVTLLQGDAVHIYSLEEIKTNATIAINGEVNAPGKYTYRPGMTLGDAVNLALGYADGVDLSNIEIAGRGGKERGSVKTIDLEASPEMINTPLSPYDVISFRKLTYFREQTTITVEGEVLSPGTYVVDKAEVRLSDIIERIGGFTDVAYVHGAKLTRVLTAEEQERQYMAVLIANQRLDEKSKIDSSLLADRYNIGIDLVEALKNPGTDCDVILREGDIISVPQMNNTVKVTGGVLYPNSVVYSKNMTCKDYIKQAGGFTKRARRGQTYAVYMNGKVAVRNNIKPEPGMEIIVPEREVNEDTKLTPVEIASLSTSATSVASMVLSLVRILL